jgi:hypothetical protein
VLELNLCQYSNTFDWFVNNGMSKHVTRNNKLITNIKDDRGTPKIKTANGIAHLVIGKGNLVTPIGKNVEIKEEILYVLGVNSNLYNKRFGVFFNSKNVFLMDSKLNVVETCSKDIMNGLYKFCIPHEVLCDFTISTIDLTHIWHRCFRHLNVKSLRLLSQKSLATNMFIIPD